MTGNISGAFLILSFQKNKMKILWLPGWYPTKITPYNGDFIRRHAEAVSLFADVHVIAVVNDQKGIVTKSYLSEETKNGRLNERIIYYNPGTFVPVYKKIRSAYLYRKLYREAIQDWVNVNGKPDIIHVHTGMKAGLLALWAKEKWGTPYVVTEHWTGFMEEAEEGFDQLTFFYRSGWKKVALHAKSISFVSRQLQLAFLKRIPVQHSVVIPNVVDTSIFHPGEAIQPLKPVFIHISNLEQRKNVNQLMDAFRKLRTEFPEASLKIVGATASVDKLQLAPEEGIEIFPEMSQPLLANELQQSTAMVLYSDCETFGCVVIESAASGVPVILSDIPVFHELVDESMGVFVPRDNSFALGVQMKEMITKRNRFDANTMARKMEERFGYKNVGKQFTDWYETVLKA
jgi:glycosyltransferase involved in cell wall biosynthesis